MYNIKAEILIGDLTGAPLFMRPTLLGESGFMLMLLTGTGTKNPEAQYMYVCLFTKDGKEVKELDYPAYRRIPVVRNLEGWKPFKGKDSSFVMLNVARIIFPLFKKPTIVNQVGIADWQGKLIGLGKLRNPFMGTGHLFFGQGDLVIRLP